MFKKFLICLTQPSRIGIYIFQKIRYSIIFLLFLLVIAMIPYGVLLAVESQTLHSSTVDVIEQTFMNYGLDHDLEIKDGILTGEEKVAAGTNELILFINPNQEDNPYEVYSVGIPVIEFKETNIVGTFNDIVIFDYSYAEAGFEDFDFNEIMNINYHKFDELINFLDGLNKEFLALTLTVNILSKALQMFILVVASAALMAYIVKMFNPFLPYRLRFKLALDCQVISIFAILLASLFNVSFIIMVGLFTSSMYLLRSLKSIVRVEIKKGPEDGEE